MRCLARDASRPTANGRGPGGCAGKGVARETLTLLRKATSAEVFKKLTWENGQRVYSLSAL